MITETSLVLAVVSRIVADSSRIVPTKTKHQAATTLVRSSGAVMSHKRLEPRRAHDAAGLLQFRMHAGEGRGHLLIAGRQLDGHEGDEQDPDGAVELEGRVGIAEEQADAEHDARDGHRSRGKHAEDSPTPATDRRITR